MYNVDTFTREYPELVSSFTLSDALQIIFIFVAPFLIAYFYIVFIEKRVPEIFRYIKVILHIENK